MIELDALDELDEDALVLEEELEPALAELELCLTLETADDEVPEVVPVEPAYSLSAGA